MKPTTLPSTLHEPAKTWNAMRLGLSAFFVSLLTAPLVLAGGGGGAGVYAAIQPAQDILDELATTLTGGTGIAIGTLAFVFVGIYIMYARSTGQAVGAVAKVIVGLVILFGGATMVAGLQTTGAVI